MTLTLSVVRLLTDTDERNDRNMIVIPELGGIVLFQPRVPGRFDAHGTGNHDPNTRRAVFM